MITRDTPTPLLIPANAVVHALLHHIRERMTEIGGNASYRVARAEAASIILHIVDDLDDEALSNDFCRLMRTKREAAFAVEEGKRPAALDPATPGD